MIGKAIKFFLGIFMIISALFNDAVAQLIDAKASIETQTLYKNIGKNAGKGIMFGHQDDLAYGVNWKYEPGRSDIKDVVGDYPAVYGWDIGGIEHGNKENLDRVPFEKIKSYIKEVYQRGGINTISWHLDNPVSLGSSWETTKAVSEILPDGKLHQKYLLWLDRVATFLNALETEEGIKIPILFRPFHELNGPWFWWGKTHCTSQEYIDLWKLTVQYLRDKKQLHHLIYVFNTNSFKDKEEFLERYPGDNYADMLSFDVYQFAKSNASKEDLQKSSIQFQEQLKNNLRVLTEEAKTRNKPAALAETGFEAIPDASWWTGTLFPAIKDFPISYVLVWRNHGLNAENKMHYYAPYKGQKSASDFKKFYKLSQILFQKEVKKLNLYKIKP